MERLTNSNAEIKKLQVENEEYWLKVYFKLKEYEDLEEQGRLIRFPCVVGDLVYRINPYGKRPVRPMRVSKVVFAKSYSGYSKIETYAIDIEDSGQYAFYEREINKSVFMTREEAEAALAEMNNMEV